MSPHEPEQHTLEHLCTWIADHLEDPIGWQDLLRVSGLDFQTLNALFFRRMGTTPMTWIRRQREARASVGAGHALNSLPPAALRSP